MIPCMATKTISLEIDAYELLRRAKREGESFSAVVRRARFGPADSRGATVLAELERLEVGVADRAAVAWWDGHAAIERTASPSPWEQR